MAITLKSTNLLNTTPSLDIRAAPMSQMRGGGLSVHNTGSGKEALI
jgi:hypothetical protein